jgi:quercetin dioxygenase-like cupin family protein
MVNLRRFAKTLFKDHPISALIAPVAIVVCSTHVPALSQPESTKMSVVFDHKLPNVPGKSLKSVLVEYAPGASTPTHTHAKSAFIYVTVLEGAINSKVNNGAIKTYKKGENFSENPGDLHSVCENASKTKPAKFLAVFVVDTDDEELTMISPSTN